MFDRLLTRIIRRIEVDDGVDGWSFQDEAAYVRNELARDRDIDIGENCVLRALVEMDRRGRTLRQRQ